MSNENRKKVIFTKDFATKKVGETFECDRTLARDLVNENVAKYEVEEPLASKELKVPKTAPQKKK